MSVTSLVFSGVVPPFEIELNDSQRATWEHYTGGDYKGLRLQSVQRRESFDVEEPAAPATPDQGETVARRKFVRRGVKKPVAGPRKRLPVEDAFRQIIQDLRKKKTPNGRVAAEILEQTVRTGDRVYVNAAWKACRLKGKPTNNDTKGLGRVLGFALRSAGFDSDELKHGRHQNELWYTVTPSLRTALLAKATAATEAVTNG